MELEIISPEKKIYSGDVESVTLPGASGLFTILNHHAPLISVLTAGKLSYKTTECGVITLDIEGGYVEMNNNHLIVCIE